MSDDEVAPEPDSATTHEPPVVDVTDGGPEMVQFLDSTGQRVEPSPASAPYAAYLDDVSEEDLRNFYRDLVLVRRVDSEGFALQRQGELGLWPSLLRQEAAQVGAAPPMPTQAYAFPGYREHGVARCKAVDPFNLLGIFRRVNHRGWHSA